MGFAVLLTLFPLVALSACPQGGGNCPAHVGRGLLQASVESTVATHVSGETAKRLLQGLHVNKTDIGIYLQSLVAKVDGHNYTLSKPEKTALETIGLMVGKMQNASVTQHAEDQQEVNRMRDLIQNCTSDAAASLAKVAAFKESASSTRKAHAACRQVEGSAKDDKTLACTTYQAHRETTTPPTCMSTELSAEYVKTDDAAKKKQMEACLVAVKSWLTPFHAKYEECKSKTDTHKNKSAECGAQQQAFEQAFCLYESKLEDTCTAQNSCRAKMIAARNSSHDGVKLAEAARKADFTASNRLLCFLDVLRANNTHKRKTLLECQNQSKQTSKFDIVYQDIPGASDCQPELTKPCDSSWQLQEYQSQAWHSKAKMEVCTPCQAPTTTTTTITTQACLSPRYDIQRSGGANFTVVGNTVTSNGQFCSVLYPLAGRSGVLYLEFTRTGGDSGHATGVGVQRAPTRVGNYFLGTGRNGNGGPGVAFYTEPHIGSTANSLQIDLDAGTVALNGGHTQAIPGSGDLYLGMYDGTSSGTGELTFNWGESAFALTMPAGAQSWCNLQA